MNGGIRWPGAKRFAFTVLDDTDLTTMQNGPPVYDLLWDLGIVTTKSVWPISGVHTPRIGGATCADPEYLDWVRSLRERGFEIALHNATYHTSTREQAIRGLEQFRELFGAYPTIQVNHADCRDSIYWGDARLTGANRVAYDVLTRFRNSGVFLGHVEGSELFWGDKCKEHIKYVRNFVYSDINTLKACPQMPYFDENRPLVNYWFASSEGPNCRAFCRTLSEANQDRLEEEGGACIMYTHFGAADFREDGVLSARFRQIMRRLSQKNGWFVPVSTLLDHIQMERGRHVISRTERNRLEQKWLTHKVFVARGST